MQSIASHRCPDRTRMRSSSSHTHPGHTRMQSSSSHRTPGHTPRRLFSRVYDCLRPGGTFVLEPQPWSSYRKRATLTPLIARHFREIRLRPQQFVRRKGPELVPCGSASVRVISAAAHGVAGGSPLETMRGRWTAYSARSAFEASSTCRYHTPKGTAPGSKEDLS
jgi:hypothetical protein